MNAKNRSTKPFTVRVTPDGMLVQIQCNSCGRQELISAKKGEQVLENRIVSFTKKHNEQHADTL